MDTARICVNCEFADALDPIEASASEDGTRYPNGALISLICRRFPPIYWCREADGTGHDDWRQPVVDSIDWCGEWKPREDS